MAKCSGICRARPVEIHRKDSRGAAGRSSRHHAITVQSINQSNSASVKIWPKCSDLRLAARMRVLHGPCAAHQLHLHPLHALARRRSPSCSPPPTTKPMAPATAVATGNQPLPGHRRPFMAGRPRRKVLQHALHATMDVPADRAAGACGRARGTPARAKGRLGTSGICRRRASAPAAQHTWPARWRCRPAAARAGARAGARPRRPPCAWPSTRGAAWNLAGRSVCVDDEKNRR